MRSIYNNMTLKNRRKELRKNQTEAEKVLWQELRNRQFFGLKFFRQYSIGMYIVDFYCPKLRLAIEVDGSQHAEKEKHEYDKERTVYLKHLDITVLRFWNNDVLNNIDEVLLSISEKVKIHRKNHNSP